MKKHVFLIILLLSLGQFFLYPKTSAAKFTKCGNLGEPCCTSDPMFKCYPPLVCYKYICTNTPPTTAPTSTPDTGSDPFTGCQGGKSINSAIGCIPVLDTKEAFLSFILKWAVGIGGGVAFLLIIYAGFMIMTSAGNPERLKAGQELLTSAISGLILLIFSVVILKIIGVDILGLCKFGFGAC